LSRLAERSELSRELKIVLASSSPRRIGLLRQIGLEFTAVDPGGDESSVHPDPRARVMENARAKASRVAEVYRDAVVIGADTVVYIGGAILGKPCSERDAAEMLGRLSGNVHKVFTGVCVIHPTRGMVADYEESLVHIRRLSEDEITRYVQGGEPMDKAGSYAIQGLGAIFVDRVVGCFHNVIGLPLALLSRMLLGVGVDLLDCGLREGSSK
jgi:septum formation protein